MRAKAAGGFCQFVLEAGDASLAPGDAKSLAPASDIGRIGRAMRATARRRMIVPGPARRRVDLETDFAAQALARGYSHCCRCLCHSRFPLRIVIARSARDEAIHFSSFRDGPKDQTSDV